MTNLLLSIRHVMFRTLHSDTDRVPLARNHICAEVRISRKACQVGLYCLLSWQPSAPAAKEWVEIRGYNNAAGTRETAKMWNVSRIFAPVCVQKHDVITSLQSRKEVQSSTTENADAFGEPSLLESLLGKLCMIRVSFNRVHATIGSTR